MDFHLLNVGSPNKLFRAATIRFDLPVASPVRLSLFDLQGRLVRDLERTSLKEAGRHTVAWDGRDGDGARLRAGVYLLRLEANRFHQAQRILMVR